MNLVAREKRVSEGIYTLANDAVCDQLIALLNSIEVNFGTDLPVCVIPYDDNLEQVHREVARHKNVTIFDDHDCLVRWDDFAEQMWFEHPTAAQLWQSRGYRGIYRKGVHRRFCAFEGAVDKFVYLDADTLVLDSLDFVLDKLDSADWVTYDFQFKDPSHVYNVQSEKLHAVFEESRVKSEIFCSGFFAGRKGQFDSDKRMWLVKQLSAGDAEVLYPWAPDQTMLNYMVMKCGLKTYNFALKGAKDKVTGNTVKSSHFESRRNVLFDHGKRLTYLHYIGIPALVFQQICSGKNVDFPYRDLFLYYRYLNEPDKRPVLDGEAIPYNAPHSFISKVLKKLGRILPGVK